jgi:phage-related protein
MDLPEGVIDEVGHALRDVQDGLTPLNAKVLSHFGGASVLEIIEDDEAGTYRAVYSVKFEEVVFVLHVFQKKSKTGIKTDKKDIELIKKRLKDAEKVYQARFGGPQDEQRKDEKGSRKRR